MVGCTTAETPEILDNQSNEHKGVARRTLVERSNRNDVTRDVVSA